MIRRPPRSTQSRSSAASDVYKRQGAIFPQSAGSILSFLRELDHLYHAVLDCSGPPRPAADEPASHRYGLLARHPLSHFRASRYKRVSVDQVFYRHLDEPLARSFFEADFLYNTGYCMKELSAPHAAMVVMLSLIHISEPTRLGMISYAVFCLKKKKKKKT